MPSFSGVEIKKKPIRLSDTVVRLPSGSFLKMGGQAYSITQPLVASINAFGLGGLDQGVKQQSQYYYIYAVISSGTFGLVLSLNPTNPNGFQAYSKVGALNTFLASSDIEDVFNIGEQPVSSIVLDMGTGGGSGLTNTRSVFFNRLVRWTGLELAYRSDNQLGDMVTILSDGMTTGNISSANSVNSQEIAIVKNYDGNEFSSTLNLNNPEFVFAISRNSNANVVSACGSREQMKAGNTLKSHNQIAGGISVTNENTFRVTHESQNRLDWSV